MFYNVVVKGGSLGGLQHLSHISTDELDRLLFAYENGKDDVMIAGTKVFLKFCSLLRVFNINPNKEWSKKSIENQIRIWGSTKGRIELFSEFGEEVTSDFVKCDWGEKRIEALEEGEDKSKGATTGKKGNKDSGKIFISHSSKNEEIVTKFCDLVLHNGLNIDVSSNVFNTSLAGSKPQTGEDFKLRIKDELINANAVFQFISKEYRESHVCMNEMGAAWVLSDNVFPLVIEKDEYEVGFIHSTNQQCQLTNEQQILEFIETLKERGIVKDHNLSRLPAKVREFVDWLNVYSSKNLFVETTPARPEPMSSESPIYKMENKTGFYLKQGKFFHQFPLNDNNQTLKLMGYGKCQVNEIPHIYNKDKGTSLQSIVGAKIYRIQNSNSSWLILNSKRHHIPDENTLVHLTTRCSCLSEDIDFQNLEQLEQQRDLVSVEQI